jgi:hypothetical protein
MMLSPADHGPIDVVVDEVPVGDEDDGSAVGVIGPVGIAVGPGTASNVLMPRLLISVDPKVIPTPRLEPLAVDVGVDDAAGLVAPEPHMLNRPEVSIMAVVVGIAEPVDAPDDAAGPDIAPDVAMLLLALVASARPPPS